MALPERMKAARVSRIGGPEVLEISDVPLPPRGPKQVLVKIVATCVNPVDLKCREGSVLSYLQPANKILGGDLAGVVAAADKDGKFNVGDKVFGLSPNFAPVYKYGTYAQYAAVSTDYIVKIPDGLSFEEAGAAPLVSLTAWQALDSVNVNSTDRVLIQAGSGGVGHVAVQLAKLKGAHVTTTCSARNIDFVKGLGADEVIDYTTEKFDEKHKNTPFDVVIDMLGADYEYRGLSVLRKNGRFVHILNQGYLKTWGRFLNMPREAYDIFRGNVFHYVLGGPRYKTIFVQPNGKQMAKIAALLGEGKLKVHVCKTFRLEDARDAHDFLENGHPTGKVAIRVSADP